jgi:hypothetical protein
MDRSIYTHFHSEAIKDTLVESHCVPKIWFGLSSSHDVTNDIFGSNKYEMIQKLTDALNDLYPKFETVCERILPETQYLRFDFRVKRKKEVKRMTVAEIEKELGYKIEIVGDK